MSENRDKLIIAGASLLPIETVAHFLSGGSTLGTVLGLGAAGIVYVITDELKDRGVELPHPPTISRGEKRTGKQGVAFKLFNGKSSREGYEGGDDQDDGDQVAPGPFVLDDVVGVIRELNARGLIYFGDSLNGAAAIPLPRMIHCLDVSASGQGKSNRLRLIMPQVAKMAETYYINPLANELKPVDDEREVEIWKPIFELLKYPEPVREGEDIGSLLAALQREVYSRQAREKKKDLGWSKKPIFVFIDELPVVYARCPKASEYLEEIGRIGRQFKVYMYLVSQTALVKESGLPTSCQSNVAVKVYGGSDETSGGRLIKVSTDIERNVRSNGAGLTYMLAGNVRDYVRAPLVTNTGLFDLLGLGPFTLSDWYTEEEADTTSPAASKFANLGASNQPAKDPVKQRNEAPGSGREVGEVGEVEQEVEENALSDRQQQIIDLFVIRKMGMREIAIELCGADGGKLYQKTAREVTDVIREYMLSLRG